MRLSGGWDGRADVHADVGGQELGPEVAELAHPGPLLFEKSRMSMSGE
jgi:hypothetical protein